MRTTKVFRSRIDLLQGKMFRACAEKYPGRHPSDVVEYLRVGEQMTLSQIATHLGVSKTTVSEWQRPEIRHMQLLTARARAASRRNVRRMNAVNQQHQHWEKHPWGKERLGEK